MILGEAVSKLETFVWIWNHVSRSIDNVVIIKLNSTNFIK